MSARTALALLLAGAATLVGSRKLSAGTPSASYYPLSTGSKWEYTVYEYDVYRPGSGNELWRRTDRTWVAGRVRLASGDSAAVVVHRYWLDETVETVETAYVRISGGCAVSRLRPDSRTCDTVLVLPPAAGKTWRSSSGGESRVDTRFAVQETVRVPAGTYRAWRVEEVLDNGRLWCQAWYAPGIGLVRVETPAWLNRGRRQFRDLVSAAIK